MPACPPLTAGYIWYDESYKSSGGAVIGLRWGYDKYVATKALPPEQQWQQYLAIVMPKLRAAGYSDPEIKWWLARTGQGPRCFKQFKIGPGGLPPYTVWRDWYFCYTQGYYGTLYYPTMPLYPPPGYIMPPFTTPGDGSKFNWNTWQWPNPLPGGFTYPLYAVVGTVEWVFDAFPSTTFGFCYDDNPGALHAVPLAFTVFDINDVQATKAFIGLPIAMMRRLDQLTSGAWWTYMDDRIRYYLALPASAGIPYANARAWPLAIKDTLAHFGLNEPAIADLAQKMDDGVIKTYENINRRPKFVNMMGDDVLAQVVTMVVIAGITMGVASAVGVAIGAAVDAAAAAEASALAAEVGVEVGIESSLVLQGITAADVMQIVSAGKTVYGLVQNIQSDNPNLLGIAGGVLSLANTFGLTDLMADEWFNSFGVSASNVATPGNLESFLDPGYGYDIGMAAQVGAIDISEGSFLLGNISTDVLSTVAPDAAWDYAGFADVAWGDMSEYADSITQSLLSGEISTPEELLASIQGAAGETSANLTDAMDVALEDYNFAELQDVTSGILADDLAMAAATDFGDLSAASFDLDMADAGWAGDLDFQNALDSAESVISDVIDFASEISLEDALKYAQMAQSLYSVVTADNAVTAAPKPAGTPTAAQIVSPAPAPAPTEVATAAPIATDLTTTVPVDTFAPVEASVAPGEILASNWGWLWALAGIAIVLPERKKRRVRRRRKARR